MESGNTLKSLIELFDFFGADAAVLGEQVKGLRVVIKSLQVNKILVDGVEGLLLRSSGEKDTGVSSLDRVLIDWWLVVRCAIHLLDGSDGELAKQIL